MLRDVVAMTENVKKMSAARIDIIASLDDIDASFEAQQLPPWRQ